MKITKFEVIQTDNGLQFVSDAGHKHYKPAIEMLLASEMFIKHNAHILSAYVMGLITINQGQTGTIQYELNISKDSDMSEYAREFIGFYEYFMVRLNLVINEPHKDDNIESAKAQKELITPVIELIKKVFNLTKPEHEKTQP